MKIKFEILFFLLFSFGLFPKRESRICICSLYLIEKQREGRVGNVNIGMGKRHVMGGRNIYSGEADKT